MWGLPTATLIEWIVFFLMGLAPVIIAIYYLKTTPDTELDATEVVSSEKLRLDKKEV